MAHVGPMWVDVGKSHFLVMVICPSGAQMGYMWCIWALVSPGKTQMGPRSFASWEVLVGVSRLAIHGAGQAAVGFPVDHGVQECDAVVLLILDGELNAGLVAVQVVE